MVLNRMFSIYIIVFTTLSSSLGENLLPPILESKVRSSLVCGSDEKLWMNFLEKELESRHLSFQTMVHKSSLLGFYDNIFKQKIFEGLPVSCKQLNWKMNEIKTYIYGEVCGSSKRGRLQYLEGKSKEISFSEDWKYTEILFSKISITKMRFR